MKPIVTELRDIADHLYALTTTRRNTLQEAASAPLRDEIREMSSRVHLAAGRLTAAHHALTKSVADPKDKLPK